MELTAVIEALKAIRRPICCHVYLDSAYVMGGFEHGWLRRWKRNQWKNSAGKPVANQDLWKQLDELVSQRDVKFFKVKGHSGHEYNERCDRLAVAESKKQQGAP